jgi:hypothetical protein
MNDRTYVSIGDSSTVREFTEDSMISVISSLLRSRSLCLYDFSPRHELKILSIIKDNAERKYVKTH